MLHRQWPHLHKADLNGGFNGSTQHMRFLRRLVHASGNEFGLMIQMILSGIEEALRSREVPLKIDHFAKQYFRAAACHPEFNPFLAEDFEKIDVQKKLLSDREQNGGYRQ